MPTDPNYIEPGYIEPGYFEGSDGGRQVDLSVSVASYSLTATINPNTLAAGDTEHSYTASTELDVSFPA